MNNLKLFEEYMSAFLNDCLDFKGQLRDFYEVLNRRH